MVTPRHRPPHSISGARRLLTQPIFLLSGLRRERVAEVGGLEHRADFEVRLNRDPFVIADRLWVKDTLDPEEEKQRFSK